MSYRKQMKFTIILDFEMVPFVYMHGPPPGGGGGVAVAFLCK